MSGSLVLTGVPVGLLRVGPPPPPPLPAQWLLLPRLAPRMWWFPVTALLTDLIDLEIFGAVPFPIPAVHRVHRGWQHAWESLQTVQRRRVWGKDRGGSSGGGELVVLESGRTGGSDGASRASGAVQPVLSPIDRLVATIEGQFASACSVSTPSRAQAALQSRSGGRHLARVVSVEPVLPFGDLIEQHRVRAVVVRRSPEQDIRQHLEGLSAAQWSACSVLAAVPRHPDRLAFYFPSRLQAVRWSRALSGSVEDGAGRAQLARSDGASLDREAVLRDLPPALRRRFIVRRAPLRAKDYDARAHPGARPSTQVLWRVQCAQAGEAGVTLTHFGSIYAQHSEPVSRCLVYTLPTTPAQLYFPIDETLNLEWARLQPQQGIHVTPHLSRPLSSGLIGQNTTSSRIQGPQPDAEATLPGPSVSEPAKAHESSTEPSPRSPGQNH